MWFVGACMQPVDEYWRNSQVCMLPGTNGVSACGSPDTVPLVAPDGTIAGQMSVFQTEHWTLYITFQVRMPQFYVLGHDERHAGLQQPQPRSPARDDDVVIMSQG